MNRAGQSTKCIRQSCHINERTKSILVHFLWFRMENQACTGCLTQLCICFQISWVACQILGWSKLHWIDKYADYNGIIFCNCLVDQALMSLMQISHRRHQTNLLAFLLPCLNSIPNFLHCCYDFHVIFSFQYSKFYCKSTKT